MALFISLLIYLVVLGVVYYIVTLILAAMNAEPPIPMIVRVVFLLFCLLLVIDLFFGSGYFPVVKWGR